MTFSAPSFSFQAPDLGGTKTSAGLGLDTEFGGKQCAPLQEEAGGKPRGGSLA